MLKLQHHLSGSQNAFEIIYIVQSGNSYRVFNFFDKMAHFKIKLDHLLGYAHKKLKPPHCQCLWYDIHSILQDSVTSNILYFSFAHLNK